MKILITIDIDWASEYAIQFTLETLKNLNIPFTVFSTHNSEYLNSIFNDIEIGLHPFFHPNSSHGKTYEETIENIFKLPYNLNAFRCHRFIRSNEISDLMKRKGMKCESNVCTNLETIPPFENRNGLLEIPIFYEDGSYLLNNNVLDINSIPGKKFFEGTENDIKTILIHPMHFVINTPNWKYMSDIKNKISRKEWNSLNKHQIKKIDFNGIGLRTFILEIINKYKNTDTKFTTVGKQMENNIFRKYAKS